MQVKISSLKSDSFSNSFIDSILNTGFAVVTDHGISHENIKETQKQWRNFYLSPQEQKDLFVNKQDPNLGYHGFKKEKAIGAEKADLKEFFHFNGVSSLPQGTEGLTNTVFTQLNRLSLKLLKILDENHTSRKISYHDVCQNTDNTILRTLYYPGLDFDLEKGAVRAAAHEDINFITLLVAASAPGLEVMDSVGNWHSVPHEENSIIVNVGDMLQLGSDGYYKSTTHRVVNPSDSRSDRISMPLFVHPHSSTVLSDGVTAKSYLKERIEAIYTRK